MEKFVENSDQNRWFEDVEVDAPATRLSAAVLLILSAILIFSGIAYGAVDTWALGLLSLASGAIAILWLVEALWSKEFWFSTNLLQAPLLGLIFIGLIQLLPLGGGENENLLSVPPVRSLSLNPYETRLFIVQLVIYLIFFAAALTFINNRKRLQKIVLTIIIFGAGMAFFGILQRLANPEAIYGLRPTNQAIPFASFINQHHFAAFMNMTLGLTLGLLFGKATKKDKNLLLLIAVFLMGIALVLTGSRGGILSFVGVLGFLVAPRILSRNNETSDGVDEPKNQNKLVLIGGVMALILGLFGAVFLLGGDESLLRSVGVTSQEDVTSGRSHFWAVAIKIFLDNPILGAGLNAFGAAFTRYDTWSGMYRVEQAHNDYLQILADAGIVGFLCAAAFIYLLFRKSLRVIGNSTSDFRKSAAHGALAGCFGILIHSFFDFPLRTPSNAFFFLTLAAIATVSIYYPKVEKIRISRKAANEKEENLLNS
jgi:O-antigen ligase